MPARNGPAAKPGVSSNGIGEGHNGTVARIDRFRHKKAGMAGPQPRQMKLLNEEGFLVLSQ
jgi:hypothetical protein